MFNRTKRRIAQLQAVLDELSDIVLDTVLQKLVAQSEMISALNMRVAELEVQGQATSARRHKPAPPASVSPLDATCQKIVELIQAGGGRLDLATHIAVADAIDTPRTTARDAINRLIDAGIVRRDGKALVLAPRIVAGGARARST